MKYFLLFFLYFHVSCKGNNPISPKAPDNKLRSYILSQLTCIEVRIAETSYVGLHLFCKMSKQIPPSA